MASSGSGNRSKGGRPGSGNRKPSTARSQQATAGSRTSSGAAERARDRLAEQQADGRQSSRQKSAQRTRQQVRRSPQRSRSSAATAGIFGGAFVVLAAVVIVLFSLLGSSGKAGAGHDPYIATRPAPANISNAVQNVPTSELAAAGNGQGISTVGKKGSGAAIVPLTGAPLTTNGKPLVVYVGGEYCPYCAATRWPLTVALSRFGTFKGLAITASSPLDAYANTHTLSYVKAAYTSPYLAFDPTEEVSNVCPTKDVIHNTQRDTALPTWESPAYLCNNESYTPLETPSKKVGKLLTTYDSAAYFTSRGAGGIPFIDFGGKYAESGAIYSPATLHGATWSQIVAAFKEPTLGIGQAVLASANRYTAMLCKVTGNKPGSVCNASYVTAAEKALGS